MHGNNALIAHGARRGKRGAQLGGMMCVIVYHGCAVALALDLKAAACPCEIGGSAHGILGHKAQLTHTAAQ